MDSLVALVLAKTLAFAAPAVGAADAARGQPNRTAILPGSTMTCVGIDKPTVRRCARLRGMHLYECVNLTTGEVLGNVLNARGAPRCSVSGVVFTDQFEARARRCASAASTRRRASTIRRPRGCSDASAPSSHAPYI